VSIYNLGAVEVNGITANPESAMRTSASNAGKIQPLLAAYPKTGMYEFAKSM
jgi:hypothetical protein